MGSYLKIIPESLPRPKIPMKSSMSPDKKHRSRACSTGPSNWATVWYVSNETIALGPSGMSLHDPNKM